MLTSDALDAFAHEYYLNGDISTVGLEELAQLLSVPRLIEAVEGRSPVLEMGFGTGLITRELLANGLPLELVEGSPVLADQARRRHPGLPVHSGLFESFEPPTPYGAVLALHVLEHVDDPVELLISMRAWLAEDGALVAVVPNAESLHRRIAVEMGLHDNLDDLSASDQLVGHQRVYDLAWLTADLDSAGYDVDFDFGYLLKTVPNSMMLDYPPAMVEALNRISPEMPTRDLANIGVRAIPRHIRGGRITTSQNPAETSAGLLTTLILSDGDPAGAAASAASAESIADHVIVLDRSDVDWEDANATIDVLEAIEDQWLLVLAAGERVRVGNVDELRSFLRANTNDAVGVHVGLHTEVRLHRACGDAMSGIGAATHGGSRLLAIAPPTAPDGPAVTIIVPTFNRPDLLRRCLEGLCVQTTDDFEVIVVNDGGLDVGHVVAPFVDRLQIRLVTQPHNLGVATAANVGLDLATSRYAHFQADDDTIFPHHVALLVSSLDESRRSGNPAGVVFGPAYMLEESAAGEELTRTVIFGEPPDPDQLFWQNVIVGGTAMFDRELAVEIGGMNTDLEVLEDWDFWLRMAARCDINYVGVPTAEYRIRAGTENVTTQAKPRFYTNLLRLYQDHPAEPGSRIERRREEQITAQTTTHKDEYAWDLTVAVIGDGDLPHLVQCLQSVMTATADTSMQLIVHELRSAAAEELLKDVALDATVCFHAVHDAPLCRDRIGRQAGGRKVIVLQSSETFGAAHLH